MSAIGYRIRSLRSQRGWSQRELAEQARVGRSWLSQVESGDIPDPGGARLDRIARAFGVTVAFVLTGETPIQSAEKGSLLAQLGRYSAQQLEQLVHVAHVIFLEEQPQEPAEQEAGRDSQDEGQEDRREDQPEAEADARRQR